MDLKHRSKNSNFISDRRHTEVLLTPSDPVRMLLETLGVQKVIVSAFRQYGEIALIAPLARHSSWSTINHNAERTRDWKKEMIKLGDKIRSSKLIAPLRQKIVANDTAGGLRVSRRSEGEGPEVLVLRTLAERSLLLSRRVRG